ncbi:hypothetical protein [Streptacidiphilus sp. PAMC 29251]
MSLRSASTSEVRCPARSSSVPMALSRAASSLIHSRLVSCAPGTVIAGLKEGLACRPA